MKREVYNTIIKCGGNLAMKESTGILVCRLLLLVSRRLCFLSIFLPPLDTCRWDLPVGRFAVNGHPLTMVFHSYDKHLVIANEHDMIR